MSTTDPEMEQFAWECFCTAHPHEAYAMNKEGFISFVQKEHPNVTREQIEQTIRESDDQPA